VESVRATVLPSTASMSISLSSVHADVIALAESLCPAASAKRRDGRRSPCPPAQAEGDAGMEFGSNDLGGGLSVCARDRSKGQPIRVSSEMTGPPKLSVWDGSRESLAFLRRRRQQQR
jgi:hypothetical protein